jgi:hypothetical protein
MATGAVSTSGEANYSGSHGEEYVSTRPAAQSQRFCDVHSDNNKVDHSYPEPTYCELQVARACTQRVPSFDLPKYNHLFDLVELAPMELTDFTKFSVAKLYCQFYDLHAVPHVLDELAKYSWLFGASNFCLSRAIHASFYKKNQLPQEIRRIIVYDCIMQDAYTNPHQVPKYDETDLDIINIPIKQGGTSNLCMPGLEFKSDTMIHKISIWQVISSQLFNNRLLRLSHGAITTSETGEADEQSFKAMPPPDPMANIFEEGRDRSVATPTHGCLKRGDLYHPTSWNSEVTDCIGGLGPIVQQELRRTDAPYFHQMGFNFCNPKSKIPHG